MNSIDSPIRRIIGSCKNHVQNDGIIKAIYSQRTQPDCIIDHGYSYCAVPRLGTLSMNLRYTVRLHGIGLLVYPTAQNVYKNRIPQHDIKLLRWILKPSLHDR